MLKKVAASCALALALIIPVSASADTLSDLRAQIAALLAQLATITQQIQSMSPAPSPATSATPASSASCVSFTQNMGEDDTDAMKNGEVSRLQLYLVSEGVSIYPEARVTGYFGPATMRALQRWQAAHGIVSGGDANTTGWGYFGPRTRAALQQILCASGIRTMPVTYIPSTTTTPTTQNTQTLMCPQYMAPYCPNGTVIDGGYLANGCKAAPICQLSTLQVTSCPQYAIPQCTGGTIVQGNLLPNGCREAPTCSTSVVSCPVYSPPPCPNGTLVMGSLQSDGCRSAPTCSVTQVSTQPSCNITATMAQNFVGQTINLTWTSNNVVSGEWTASPFGVTGSVSPTGTRSVVASTAGTHTFSLDMVSPTGVHVTCSRIVFVFDQGYTPSSGQSASMDSSSLSTHTGTAVIKGSATGLSNVTLTVRKGIASYPPAGDTVHTSGTVAVSNGAWTYTVPGTLADGYYGVYVYGNDALMVYGTLSARLQTIDTTPRCYESVTAYCRSSDPQECYVYRPAGPADVWTPSFETVCTSAQISEADHLASALAALQDALRGLVALFTR